MSATYAPPPKFAPTIWRDNRNLYMQLATDKQVLTFPLTEGGLGKAIKLIPTIVDQPGYLSGRHNIADKILVKVSKQTKIRPQAFNKLAKELNTSVTSIIRRRFK